jgi:integrase
MASIFQRGKYWRAQVRHRGYPTLTATFDTKLEAQQWAVQKEKELSENTPEQVQQHIKDRQFTLSDALDRYEREILPTKSASAQHREPSYIRSLRKDLGSVPLATLDGGKLTAAVSVWRSETGWSANHIRLHLALLSFLYGIARKEWGMSDIINPVPLIRKPKMPGGRDRRLEGDEESRLLEACEAINPEVADIVRFAIATAMRQGEILALTWERVDLQRHTVFLPTTKNGEPRLVPLSRTAEACLSRRQKDKGPVWSLNADSLKYYYFKAVKKAGITGLTFHDLRHEATSRLVEKGLPIMTVQAITGHKSTQMLKRYTHISADKLVEAVRKD